MEAPIRKLRKTRSVGSPVFFRQPYQRCACRCYVSCCHLPLIHPLNIESGLYCGAGFDTLHTSAHDTLSSGSSLSWGRIRCMSYCWSEMEQGGRQDDSGASVVSDGSPVSMAARRRALLCHICANVRLISNRSPSKSILTTCNDPSNIDSIQTPQTLLIHVWRIRFRKPPRSQSLGLPHLLQPRPRSKPGPHRPSPPRPGK